MHTPEPQYSVESFANGLFLELTNRGSGITVFLQGDDAIRTLDELDRAAGDAMADEIISEYFD